MTWDLSPATKTHQDGHRLSTALLCLCLVFSRLAAWRSFPIFDDAFITFRYGWNLANGNGFVYNSGDSVLGTTSPFFGLLNAALTYLGGAPEIWIPSLNIAFDVAIALLVRRLLFSSDSIGFAFFIAFFAISPVQARTSIGGMEVDLFTFMTLLSFTLYGANRAWLAVIVAALSYFVRPEGVLTVAVLCGSELLAQRRIGRAIGMGIVALLCVAPFLAAMDMNYGSFLPQSVVAKHNHIRIPPFSVLLQLLAPDPVSGIIAALGLLGLYGTLRGPNPAHCALAIWFALYVFAYVAAGPKIWSWYSFAPLCVAATMAARLLSVARFEPWNRMRRYAAPIAGCAIVLFWVAVGVVFGRELVSRNVYGALKQYCRSHLMKTDTVLATDAGIIGYACPSMVLDAEGLVWQPASAFRSQWEIIPKWRPDYIFLTVTKTSMAHMSDASLRQSYEPVMRFAADGVSDPARIRNFSDNWIQEYVLYRRRGAS